MISIIMPVYNVEKDIRNIMNCLLKQTVQNFELIVVDDCSTDNSIKIIQEFVGFFEDIKIYNTPKNLKQGGARNLGIECANREYLGFIDPDDYLDPDYIKVISEKILLEKSDIIAMDYYEVKNGIKYYKSNDVPIGPMDIKKKKEILSRKYGWELWQQVYKKSIFLDNDIKFSENLFVTDLEIGALLYLYANNISKINQGLYYYVKHEEATTAFKRNDTKVYHLLDISVLRINHFKERGLYDQFKEEIDYVFFWHVGIISMFRAYYNFDKNNQKMIKDIIEKLAEFTPNIKQNQYFKKDKKLVKIFHFVSIYGSGILTLGVWFLKKFPYKYLNNFKSKQFNENNLQ